MKTKSTDDIFKASEETSGVPRAHNWKVVQKDKGKYIREKEGGELTKSDTIVNRDLIRGS